jgi:hypothetical protein
MDLPTYAKKRQYMPANMGSGIDANKAPNFPGLAKQISSMINLSQHQGNTHEHNRKLRCNI